MRGLRLYAGGVLLLLLPAVCQAGIGSELNGLGSFGASVGLMRWLADADAREYNGEPAQVRPIGKAVFRYRINTNWLVSIESGYGWNGYADSDNLVTTVIPTTFGLERRIGDAWGATTSATFGAGFYVWARRRDRETLRDPETSAKLNALEPGGYVGMCGEFHVSDHVTCALHTSFHYMISVHGDDFPTTMGGNDLFMDLRVGINYYFSPYEGLIWETASED